jgi:N utilization substance protein A
VKDIVRELQGEKIDIIKWSEDVREYVRAAMSPAEINEAKVDKTTKKIEIIVNDDQLSIAIGKHGQNVRLASKLIGWEIDVRGSKPKEEVAQVAPAVKEAGPAPAQAISLEDLEGVGEKTRKVLEEAGYDTVEKIGSLTVEDLTKLKGIGEKTAEKIINSAKNINAQK